ncbi:MAG: hypothetical protein ABW194_07990, partial [Novosphingobium sp.]
IYRGKIVHKGEAFDGEHAPIVAEDLWNEVQHALANRAQGHSRRLKARQPSLLVGLLIDGEGRAMTPNHATKPGLRYRYYVTRPDLIDGSPAWRVSAHDLEKLVCQRLAELLIDQQALCSMLENSEEDAKALHSIIDVGDLMAATLRSDSAVARIRLLQSIITQIVLRDDAIDIAVQPTKLLEALGHEQRDREPSDPILLTCHAMKVRRGHQLRLLIPSAAAPPPRSRDEKLVALVAEAHAARQLVVAHPDQSIASIAATANRCRARLAQLLKLSCLAPDIVTAIVEGRQPATLTARSLLAADVPPCWQQQRSALGFS